MTAPEHVKYLIIGAGVHGLSTAYHLSLELKKRGTGSAADIVVIDKTDVGAGASGIACGVVPQQLLPAGHARAHAHSVEVWKVIPKL